MLQLKARSKALVCLQLPCLSCWHYCVWAHANMWWVCLSFQVHLACTVSIPFLEGWRQRSRHLMWQLEKHLCIKQYKIVSFAVTVFHMIFNGWLTLQKQLQHKQSNVCGSCAIFFSHAVCYWQPLFDAKGIQEVEACKTREEWKRKVHLEEAESLWPVFSTGDTKDVTVYCFQKSVFWLGGQHVSVRHVSCKLLLFECLLHRITAV